MCVCVCVYCECTCENAFARMCYLKLCLPDVPSCWELCTTYSDSNLAMHSTCSQNYVFCTLRVHHCRNMSSVTLSSTASLSQAKFWCSQSSRAPSAPPCLPRPSLALRLQNLLPLLPHRGMHHLPSRILVLCASHARWIFLGKE